MAIEITHQFVSNKVDGADATQVQPSNWNDTHDIEQAGQRLLGKPTAGDGATTEIPIGQGLEFDSGTLQVTDAVMAGGGGGGGGSTGRIVGEVMAYAGISLPSGWLWCDGSAISRTTYSDLFDALTAVYELDVTNGSPILGGSNDVTAMGLEGAYLEGTGIQSGATVTNANASQVTMSLNATATNADQDIRFFPYGRGNGTTTFNLPDYRGRVLAGRDNMGGTDMNRIDGTSSEHSMNGSELGSSGGDDEADLDPRHLPGHNHDFTTDSGGSHTHTVGMRDIFESGTNRTGATSGSATSTMNTGSGGSHTHTGTTENQGDDDSHNNMQPTHIVNHIIYTGV